MARRAGSRRGRDSRRQLWRRRGGHPADGYSTDECTRAACQCAVEPYGQSAIKRTCRRPQEAPPETLKLDPNANPTQGDVVLDGASLEANFFFRHFPPAGGDIDASYLGGGCVGFVSAQPTVRISLINPLPGLLRFFFINDDTPDVVMIIEDPDGHFHCSDDGYGTVNPTIDFNGPVNGFPRMSAPSAGAYNVWIGSHTTPTKGTFFITINKGDHP